MKFKTYLEQINGVDIYPIISLILFFSFFVLVSFLIFRTSKTTIQHIEELPLDND